jgi:eukaryotic-like serine/threonine-protein kinase
MDTERYALLKTIVAAAVSLPEPERPDFLHGACGSDADLRLAAESLLAHEAGVPALLATAGAHLGEAADAGPGTGDPGQIGPYTLHEVLGRGGMGVVYRASQTAPLRREVALKLVRPGSASEGVLARFEAERQTVARFDHPAIARVLDAGSAPDGRPYFAMELVRGPSITAFADEARLTVRARLDLFLAVCAGVQYAHQKGIIHRDLKPSNILVAQETDGPRPRIIDFGIARAVEEAPEAGLTAVGILVGTPEYMSPEHVGLVEGGVDTRTDVFALGVVLFELLTGERPYRFARLTAGEIHRVLSGPPPRRPSAAVWSAAVPGPAAAAVSAARGATPERLARLLRGDLDNVVLKALAREPRHRYASVEHLASDIRRHLTGRPVEARAGTWTYRTGKFVRRHALAVAVAVILAATLAASAAVTLWQARVVAQERDRARREAVTARQVAGFLVDVFELADPSRARGSEVTVREALDRGAARIPSELAGRPAVRARLLSAMGQVYHSLGLYSQAAPLLDQALREYEAMPDVDTAELADTLDLLGVLAHDLRDMPRAESYARRGLELRRRALGPEHESVGVSLVNLATAIRAGGRHAEAEPLYREGLALLRARLGDEHERVGWAIFNLAWALHQQGRLDEAEPLYREAAALQRRILGDTHPDLGDTLNSLAGIYYHRGQAQAAADLWSEALAMYRRLYGDEHTATARAYQNMAHATLDLGDLAQAEALYRRAVEVNLAIVGPDHPHAATTLHSHGLALWRLGRHAQAEAPLRRALAVRERAFGPESRLAGLTLAGLAQVLAARGSGAEAEVAARRAARIADAEAAQWPSDAATMLESLATVLGARRAEEAAALWRRALDLREAAQDSSPQRRALARAGLGQALLAQGDSAAGVVALRAAAATLHASLPEGHRERRRVQALLDAAAPSSGRR